MKNFCIQLANEVYEKGIHNIDKDRLRFIYVTIRGKLDYDAGDLSQYELNYLQNTIEEISDERVDHIEIKLGDE